MPTYTASWLSLKEVRFTLCTIVLFMLTLAFEYEKVHYLIGFGGITIVFLAFIVILFSIRQFHLANTHKQDERESQEQRVSPSPPIEDAESWKDSLVETGSIFLRLPRETDEEFLARLEARLETLPVDSPQARSLQEIRNELLHG